jgi:uncharacterized RDD family membrane protein YckC
VFSTPSPAESPLAFAALSSTPFESLSSHKQAETLFGRRVELWRRAATAVLDSLLFSILLGIGWWAWFLLVAGRGQTPAKVLLKTRVASYPLLSQIGFAKTIGRYLIPSLIPQLVLMQTLFGLVSLPFGFGTIWLAISWVASLLPLVDALWLFGPAKRRLIDVVLKTDVVSA